MATNQQYDRYITQLSCSGVGVYFSTKILHSCMYIHGRLFSDPLQFS